MARCNKRFYLNNTEMIAITKRLRVIYVESIIGESLDLFHNNYLGYSQTFHIAN